jgi:hypothetical protein
MKAGLERQLHYKDMSFGCGVHGGHAGLTTLLAPTASIRPKARVADVEPPSLKEAAQNLLSIYPNFLAASFAAFFAS